MHNFSRLEQTKHMLEWLNDDPYSAIVTMAENVFSQQVSGSKIVEFVVTSEPDWLTGGLPEADNPDKMVLVRAAVAFECAIKIGSPDGQLHELQWVFTLAGVNLNNDRLRSQRLWVDLGGVLEEFGSQGALMTRVYFDVDSED